MMNEAASKASGRVDCRASVAKASAAPFEGPAGSLTRTSAPAARSASRAFGSSPSRITTTSTIVSFVAAASRARSRQSAAARSPSDRDGTRTRSLLGESVSSACGAVRDAARTKRPSASSAGGIEPRRSAPPRAPGRVMRRCPARSSRTPEGGRGEPARHERSESVPPGTHRTPLSTLPSDVAPSFRTPYANQAAFPEVRVTIA